MTGPELPPCRLRPIVGYSSGRYAILVAMLFFIRRAPFAAVDAKKGNQDGTVCGENRRESKIAINLRFQVCTKTPGGGQIIE